MNRHHASITSITLLLTLLCMGGASAGVTIEPVYPGAVIDKHAGDVTVRVYLSHDPLNKVVAWYARKIGTFNKEAGNTLWNGDGLETYVGRPNGATEPQVSNQKLGRVTMHQSEVVKSLKDMTMTKDVGVFCEGMQFKTEQTFSPQAAANSADSAAGTAADTAMQYQLQKMQAQLNQASQQMLGSMNPQDIKIAQMGDLFDGLRQQVGKHGHTKQQLLTVYKKYKHLETAWYPTVKTPDGLKSYDRWLLARKIERLKAKGQVATPAMDGNEDAQTLAERMQAAAAAGRMDEMQALGEKLQSTMEGQEDINHHGINGALKDHWRFWLAFLKDLDAHAYRTRIWINTIPESWGY